MSVLKVHKVVIGCSYIACINWKVKVIYTFLQI